MPSTKRNWPLLYSFIVFIVLASLDNAAAGVLPPLYAIISRDLGANDAALGGVTAVYLIIVALSAIYWGYRGDRTKRKPLLFYGTLLWGAAMIFTAMSQTFTQFLIFQMVTAVFLNLFTNPWVIFAFLVAFAAIALQSTDPPNWAAMITDVNLPEHRGTVIGISRLFRAVGNALSVGAAGFLITALAADCPSPDNYALTLAAFQFLVIPAGFCYYKVSQNIVKDRMAVTNTLKARAETAVSP